MITRLAPVGYDPAAQCPTWSAFLGRIFAGDQDVIAFVQRAVGYGLTGSTSEQCMFIGYGSGANGKGTLMRAVRALLGDYGQTAAEATFTEHGPDRVSNDLAALRGARLVDMSETESGQRLSEKLIKRVTGQDPVTCRFLFSEFFTYIPTFKLWFFTNHKPEIRDAGDAMWRRIRLIPFTVTIPREEWDVHLDEKLRVELPGILNWALDGCDAWQRLGGLREPDVVRAATAQYRDEQDLLGPFLGECCVSGRSVRVTAAALYGAYTAWCEANHEKPLAKRTFGQRLGEKGFQSVRGTGGIRLYEGVGLKADPSVNTQSDVSDAS